MRKNGDNSAASVPTVGADHGTIEFRFVAETMTIDVITRAPLAIDKTKVTLTAVDFMEKAAQITLLIVAQNRAFGEKMAEELRKRGALPSA